MKSLSLAGLLPLVLATAPAAILFEDTFDRPDSRNIQESLTGITNNIGLTAGSVYLQPFMDPNNRAPTYGVQDADAGNGGGQQILGNQYQIAVGAGTSNVLVNHNFTDAAILSAGGFSISLDVLGYSQATNQQGAAIAVGLSQADAQATTDAYSGTTRMTGAFGTAIGAATPAASVSDFWVAIRGDKTLVWGNRGGTVSGTADVGTKAGTLAVNFRFTSFAAGSPVTFEVIVGGVLQGKGSFTWSRDNTNFVGIDTRDAALVSLDNFLIGTDAIDRIALPPYVDSFEATRLPGTPNTRFHWKVAGGTVGDPLAVTIANGSTVLNTSSSKTGYVDVNTSATDFTLHVGDSSGGEDAQATAPAASTYVTAVTTDTPSLWYRFNGLSPIGSLISDSSGSTKPHEGTTVGVVTTVTGAIDGAGYFNGGGSNILTDLVFDPASTARGFTVEAVVRRTATTQRDSAIVSQLDLNGTGRSILAVDNDGTIESFLSGGAAQRKTADVKLPADTWAHLVMVVDKVTPEIRWYLDGVQIGSTTDGVNADGTTFNPAFALESSSGAWRIGSHKDGTQAYWSGNMDEVAVYPTLLDDPNGDGNRADSRVAAHSNAWFASAHGLLGYYAAATTIDAGTGTTFTVKVGSDISSVSVDNGVGTLTPVNGVVTFTVKPAATTTYTLTAGSETQAVTVNVNGAVTLLAPVITSSSVSGGNFVLNFTGSPTAAYNVRGSLDLATFGIDLGSVTTDASGKGTATLPLTTGRASQFYRVETPATTTP